MLNKAQERENFVFYFFLFLFLQSRFHEVYAQAARFYDKKKKKSMNRDQLSGIRCIL